MIRPPPRSTSSGAKARSVFAVPVRLTSIWSCQSASAISSSGRNAWMPAFAKRMSIPPNSSRTLSAAARSAAMSRMSAGTASQRRPVSDTSRPVSSRSSGVAGAKSRIGLTGPAMSMPTTSAPAAASAAAADLPMPRAAPVTTATLPANDIRSATLRAMTLSYPRRRPATAAWPRRPDFAMMSATSRAQARFRVVTDRANAEDWLPVSESRSTGAPAPPPLAATSRESAQEEYSQVVTDAVVDTLLDEVRDEMGTDTAAVLLRDESEQYLIATAARGIEIEVRQGARVRAGRGFAGRIFAERRPVVLDRISPENVVNPLLLRRGIVSMLGVPLITGEDVIGVVHVGSLTARRFTQDDVRQLERAARRIGRALTRHRSFVDRTAARALQDSLIPTLPELDGVSLAARYVPGSQYGVGGDWYDVFQLPNGLIGITIGDVMGHGLHAATMMGRVRSSLQSYAIEVTCPARVLERLDRKLLHFARGLLCTVCYAIMNPLDGRLVVSAAGHLPPALE